MGKTTEIRDGKEVQIEVIPIYVRKSERPRTRLVSFQRPEDAYLDSLLVPYVLPMGLAFDGNSVSVEVTSRTKATHFTPNDPTDAMRDEDPPVMYSFISEGDEERSLTAALNGVQFALKQWLMLIGERALRRGGGPGVHVYFT